MNKKVLINDQVFKKMNELTKKYENVENGGLIYGRLNPRWALVEDISDAGQNAVRKPYGVSFDPEYLNDYTLRKIEEKLYVIGTWHSHPSGSSLTPSSIDKKTMLDIFKHFDHSFSPIFCIVKWENNELSKSFFTIAPNLNLVEIPCNITSRS